MTLNNEEILLSQPRKLPNQVLSKTDPGDEVQKRFRYQHTYTALVAIQMFAGNVPYTELYCELHEDILALKENGKYVGIQIKTKQLTDGALELTDHQVRNSLLRFIELNTQFVGDFDQFVIVSNCPFRKDKTGYSIVNLLGQIRSGTRSKFSPRTLDKYIKGLAEETNVEIDDVINVLAITEIMIGPGLDDIDSKIIDQHLGNLPICSDSSPEKLRIILQCIREKIYTASSKLLANPIKDYWALSAGHLAVEAEEINAKRITKESISNYIQQPVNSKTFLGSRGGNTVISRSDSNHLMMHKMACGFIDPEDIEMMDDLRNAAETYFIENAYKAENNTEYVSQYNQIRTIVLNQSREAKSRCKKQGNPYGQLMLQNIEDRLDGISKTRSADVFFCPYEIMKGTVGILTNDCKVAFSEEPVGGWQKLD